jgi:hypothetical protein
LSLLLFLLPTEELERLLGALAVEDSRDLVL